MKRFLTKILLIVIPTSIFAQGTERDAQSMLSQLGYQISVDGRWGPQSQRVIDQFYTDQGLTYDGVLDETELNDLKKSVSLKRNLHNNASPSSIDYSQIWNFNYDDLKYLGEHDDYRLRIRSQIHSNNAMQNLENYRPDTECTTLLFNKATFNTWQGNEIWNRRNITRCMIDYYRWVLTNYEHQLEPDDITRRFWNQMPVWIESKAFVIKDFDGGDWSYSQDEKNNDLFFIIARAYYILGDYYEIQTLERDAQMYDYWQAFMAENVGANVKARNVDVCYPPNTNSHTDVSSIYPTGPGMSTGLCANGAAQFAYHLGLAGLYHKNNNFINEAVWVARNITSGATQEGATYDAQRGGQAPHYLSTISLWLDMLAQDLEYYFDYNLYEQAGQNGVMVGDVIRYGYDVWMNPRINYKYAVLGELIHNWTLDKEPQALESIASGIDLDKLQSYRARQLVGSLLREDTKWSRTREYEFFRPTFFHHRDAIYDVRYDIEYEEYTWVGSHGQIERYSVEGYRAANCRFLDDC